MEKQLWVIAGHYDGGEVWMSQIEASNRDEAEAKFWEAMAADQGLEPDEVPEDKYIDGCILVRAEEYWQGMAARQLSRVRACHDLLLAKGASVEELP